MWSNDPSRGRWRSFLRRVGLGVFLGLLASGRPADAPIPIERDYTVRTWRKEHGLPDNRVLSLLVARDGFLWVGTRAGAARFDGHKFEIWGHPTHAAFTNDTCRALAEGPDGRLWVATDEGVVVLGERPEWPLFTRGSSDPAAVSPSGPVAFRNVLATLQGRVLAGCENGLWVGGDTNGWPSRALADGLARVTITRLLQTADEAVWAGTDRQLYRLAPGANVWEPQFAEGAASETHYIHSLAAGGDNTVFVIRGNWPQRTGWLYRRTATAWQQVSDLELFNAGEALCLAAGAGGGVWFSETPFRLGWWRDGEHRSYSLDGVLNADDRVLCLAEDGDQNLWLGTESGGLYCLQRRRVATLTARDGLPHANTWALLEAADGAFWVGTDGGLARFQNGTVRTFVEDTGLANPRVRALAEDAQGRVWIGTGAGLNVWNGTRLDAVRFEGPWFRTKIRCLLRARDDAMWVGTAQGLHRLRNGESRSWFPEDGLPHEDVRVILEARDGGIWLGTHGGGLAHLHGDGFERFDERQGLSSPRVWALTEDEDGWLWIGTDRGLNCLREGRISPVTTAQGLPDNLVNSLILDPDGWFWIGHDSGIYRVRRADVAAVVTGRQTALDAVVYDESDGLVRLETNGQISQPAVLRRRDGRVAFATVAGVALFDPRRLPDLTNGPPARIERLVAGNVPLFTAHPGAPTNGLEHAALLAVPNADRHVAISFTAPNFRSGEKTRFRYRLLGLNAEWVEAGLTRVATYAHLAPGDYTFEVVAANAQGYWSATPARIAFRIEPRLFERAGVQLTTALALAGAAGWIIRWRQREARRFQQLEHAASLARERERMSRDLHDGLGSCLTEISLLSCQGETAGWPATAGSTFQALARRSGEALEALRELIWANNPKADNLGALLARAGDQVDRMLTTARIRARFDLPADPPMIAVGPVFRRQVLLALREAVNNAVRHAQARQVTLRATPGPRQLVIEVTDDGVGFQPGAATHAARAAPGLGLHSMRQRIESLGGGFELHSAPGAGTRVIFRLPLPHA